MLKLPHIASRIFDAPLLIAPGKLEQIIQVLSPRFLGQVTAMSSNGGIRRPLQVLGGVAIVPVVGTLTQRRTMDDAESGLLSYEVIRADIEAALANPQVRAILLDIDSGGGEVAGNFDLVDRIFEARAEKPIWAVANEFAASAAYSIASAAERVFVSRTGLVGSVGVIVAHLDRSGFDEQNGLQWTMIYAGARKNDLSPHAPLGDEARGWLQKRVDTLYDVFVGTVARNRAMSESAVRATEADAYSAEDAVAIGFADEIASFEEVLARMTQEISSQGGITPIQTNQTKGKKTMTTTPQTKNENEQPKASLPEAAAVPAASPAAETAAASLPAKAQVVDVEQVKADARSAERDRCAAILASSVKIGVSADFALTLIRDGVGAGEASTRMIDRKAEESPANAIQANNPAATESSAVDESLPLEDRCKAKWDKEPKLRAEFGDNFKRYLAFEKNYAAGNIKIKTA